MPRYRFRWELLTAALTRRLARELQLDGEPATALRKAYGARPSEDFVRDAWPILCGEWLAKDGPARRSVVALLRERGLGDIDLPVGNRQEQLGYLKSCRNSATLRQVVLDEFRTSGSAADIDGDGQPTNRADAEATSDSPDTAAVPPAGRKIRREPPEESTVRPGGRVIRSEPPEFDLDKRLAIAWIQLGGRLTSALGGLLPDETLIIELPSAYDENELTGSAPYLRFGSYGDGGIHGEVSGNHVLDERHRLSDEQRRALLEIGWAAPGPSPADVDGDDCLNFEIDVQPSELADLAGMSIATIRDVFGVPHPSFLVAADSDEEPGRAAESLGLSHPARDESSVVEDETLAIEPADRDHLIELVDAALVPVVGGPPGHDDDGDIPIRSGSAIVFVRVAQDGPYIELFSPVLVEVEGSPLALERISQLNRWVRFVSFGWDSGTVHASMHLYCHPFVPEHLRHAVGVLTSVADRLDDELRLGLGGRPFFGDDEPSSTDEPPADDESDDGELPEALLTILQLDSEGEGERAISAEEVANICSRNRADILRYIRIAELQVIEWRSSAEEALSEGDSAEWAACIHEGKAWQSTVDLLRSALRLVARG